MAGDPKEVYLCTFHEERQSRTEISTCLVFDPKNKRFRIQVSQDYETQAKINFNYFDDADAYLAKHPEYREKAGEAIKDHLAENPEHEKSMKAVLAQMKNF